MPILKLNWMKSISALMSCCHVYFTSFLMFVCVCLYLYWPKKIEICGKDDDGVEKRENWETIENKFHGSRKDPIRKAEEEIQKKGTLTLREGGKNNIYLKINVNCLINGI